jgi:hypothetical protein
MNVGMKAPPDDLEPWIPKGGGGYDLIVVGVQECSYRNRARLASDDGAGGETDDEDDDTSNRISDPSISPAVQHRSLNSLSARKSLMKQRDDKKSNRMSVAPVEVASSGHDHRFINTVASHVGAEYVPVDTVALMAMRLVVFIHVTHQDCIDNIEKTTEATGIGRMVGNKGAVMISFAVYQTSLCFVSCHLAAHDGEKFLARRNADARDIFKHCLGKENDVSSMYHHCFMFGDLNYR